MEGLRLSGLFLNHSGPPTICVIVCHGFNGTKEGGGKAIEMAEFFAERKISSLLFDFSGSGESEGRFEDITLSRQIRDLFCAVRWVEERGATSIFLMGRSFGGTTVLCFDVKDHPLIKGVVSLNGVALPQELFARFISSRRKHGEVVVKGVEGEVVVREEFFYDLKRWDVLERVSRISPVPLLIVQAEEDEFIPISSALQLYERAGEPKKIVILRDEDHVFSRNPSRMWNECLYWIEERKGEDLS